MSIPSIDLSVAIAKHLKTARKLLHAYKLYIADFAIINEVEWKRNGRCHKLIIENKPSDDNTLLAPKPMASILSAASTDKALEAKDNLAISIVVVLSIVSTISNADFYFTANARWRGKLDFMATFDKVKATSSVGAPIKAAFAANFPISLKTLAAICDKIVTSDYKEQKGINVGVDGCRIKFCHLLFEPKDDNDEDLKLGTDVTNVDPQHNLDNIDVFKENIADVMTLMRWPVCFDSTCEALEDMDGKFHVVFISAYNMHSELIYPNFYTHQLKVVVRFTLTHWSIKNINVYIADVKNIRV
ncbi:hypothetical protein PHLGIDRAFT_119428 [Phlebiopsis gigantea 11061_1 CR5-6]|uniref:Uncharacterized protein n=1 Tax=Phlebiopsis gigantea (strain 11061_1 CR5-6) TaxID=745531 RepID=A0A0C3S945_PHLG1|nr:hypothetical protein PHLGIDRAFT_119428 [Phlebiopsis gigantea 11061_1 CR5-6]